MKLKKGDNVLIISGKDKGKKGQILNVFPKGGKILIEGVNLRKKHSKPKKQGMKGQIISVPSPINASNVMVVCSKCSKATRISYKIVEDNKFRKCKKCEAEFN